MYTRFFFSLSFLSFNIVICQGRSREGKLTGYTETHEFRIKFVGFSIDFLSIRSYQASDRSPAGRFPFKGKKQFPLFFLHSSQKDTSPWSRQLERKVADRWIRPIPNSGENLRRDDIGTKFTILRIVEPGEDLSASLGPSHPSWMGETFMIFYGFWLNFIERTLA